MKLVNKNASFFEDSAPSLLCGMIAECEFLHDDKKIYIACLYINEADSLEWIYSLKPITELVIEGSDAAFMQIERLQKEAKYVEPLIRPEHKMLVENFLKDSMVVQGLYNPIKDNEWDVFVGKKTL